MFFRTFGNRLRHAGMDFSNTIRSKLLPALAAFALFFVVSAAYFAPQFRGEALPQHDVIQYEGMAKDISDMRAATGEDPQWTGGMFGGMPAYLINVAYPAQLVKRTVGQVVKIIDTPAGFLFFAMVSMWLMLLIVGINPWVGIVAALAYARQRQLSREDTARLAMATGAANVMCSGTQAARLGDIEQLLPQVRITRL